jgi:GT2 family glycosyltransferase
VSESDLALSVIIPTHNRRESLRRVLEALSSQVVGSGPFEVAVVCDGCTDGTAEMCRSLTVAYQMTVIEQTQQGPAAARNAALARARGQLVVFLDDDVVPAPGLLEAHLEAHAGGDVTVAIGPLLAPPGDSLDPWTRWEAAMLEGQYQAMAAGKWQPTPRQFYTGNASVRRRPLVEAGGFNTDFRRAEDVELAYRLQALNMTFTFVPKAKGWHFARRTLASWLNTAREYGVADVVMYRQGRRMTLQSMAREFQWRHAWLRRLARVTVGRRRLLDPFTAAALAAARVLSTVRLTSAANSAYSAVFNLAYWQGVSSELGGRREFWRLIETGQGPASA